MLVPLVAGMLMPLQGAAGGCCCQSTVCAMKLGRGCWCRCRGWLRDVYGSVGVGWTLLEITYFMLQQKGEHLVANYQKLFFAIVLE